MKELGEIQVEVAQEGVHADHVGQRGAEVAAVFLHPVFQRLLLEVAQAYVEGLESLHVFVGHGPDRHQVEFLCQVDVRGALEELRQLARHGPHHFFVPLAGKAAAYAEVEEVEGIQALWLRIEGAQFLDLLGQAPPSLFQRGGLVEAAEIQLVDDVEDEDLEAHHVHDRTGGADAQVGAVGRHFDELALEAEQGQEVGEVALDEAQRAHVLDLVLREHHPAQVIEFALDFLLQLGQRKGRRVAALEFVLADGVRVHVQEGLPHREFIEVGFDQAADDWFH